MPSVAGALQQKDLGRNLVCLCTRRFGKQKSFAVLGDFEKNLWSEGKKTRWELSRVESRWVK
jgi:hypothetical protein